MALEVSETAGSDCLGSFGCVQRAMSLTAEQESAVREAHGQFVARQQSLAQHRSQALPYLQAALYTSADPSTRRCLGCTHPPFSPTHRKSPLHLSRSEPPIYSYSCTGVKPRARV